MEFERTDRLSLGALTISPAQILANRYDLLSRVADGLAHEVKNPIHAAVINLELLRRRIRDPDVELVLERIDLLEDEVTSVHDLIDAFFRFLRSAEEGTRVIDLDEALYTILPMARAYCRVARVEVEYEPARGALVRIGSAAVQQIVLNLIVNAVEAMRPDGGRLKIASTVSGEEIHLRIMDTGPGFPAGCPPTIGEPGVTTRPGRAGLGLAISRHLAEEAGGRVEIEEPDGDATGAHLLLALRKAASA